MKIKSLKNQVKWSAALCLALTIAFYITTTTNTQEKTPDEFRKEEFLAKRAKKAAGIGKFNGPDEFIKIHKKLRTADDEPSPSYPQNYQISSLQNARQERARKRIQAKQELNFVERGPANVPGRTRGILVDTRDPNGNTWFAASASGGIWKTSNGGLSWVSKTDDLPSLALTSIAASASTMNIIYAGSGEGFGNLDGVAGNGIFKSEDGGETWQQLESTANNLEFRYVNRLAVDPSTPNYVVAATNTGIFTSADGGQTWQKNYSGLVQDLRATPNNFQILYGGVNGLGVIKSVDKGLTWTAANSGLNNGARFEIAVSPAKTDRIFASAEGTGASYLYVSDNGGDTWSVMNEGTGTNQNYLGNQGWYDNTIEAHPFNKDIVFVGGIDQWRATVTGEPVAGAASVTAFDFSSVSSFISFVNYGGSQFGGILEVGSLTSAEFRSVEIRFGNGLSQKAHRFSIPSNAGTNSDGGAGVPASQYIYEDYVDVPFQVWDTQNNIQLMTSFRDQEDDGTYDLEQANTSDNTRAREYLYVHAIPYNATTPATQITKNGGHEEKQMYFMWPQLAAGANWDANNLPSSQIKIKYGASYSRTRSLETVTDGYSQRGGKNSNVHVDQHNIVVFVTDANTQNFKLIIGNDGGVWSTPTSTNPGFLPSSWAFTGNGYNTTQFYGADKKPNSFEFIAGAQDNGTWKSIGQSLDKNANYGFMIGGDGFETIWNNQNPERLIGGYQNNNFFRSTNGGATWVRATTGLTDIDGSGPFVSRLANSKSNPNIIFTIGASGVWRSENFGESWKRAALPSSSFSSSSTSNVDVSLANSKVVWAFDAMSASERVHLSIDGGISFNAVNNYTERVMGNISGFATHPNDFKTAYALFSFYGRPKVLKTTDLGQTWADLSGFGTESTSSNGFPNVAVYSLMVMPHNPDWIWAGTEIGLVESFDGGQTWAIADYNLPAVCIWEMKWMDDQVILATHGRGIWTVEIPELPELAFDPVLVRAVATRSGSAIIEAGLISNYDSTLVFINGQIAHKELSNNSVNVEITVDTDQAPGSEVILRSYYNGRAYESYPKLLEEPLSTGNNSISLKDLQIYPNPSDGRFTIQAATFNSAAITVSVYSYLGKVINKTILPVNRQEATIDVDLGNVPTGIYIIQVEDGIHKYQSRIIIR